MITMPSEIWKESKKNLHIKGSYKVWNITLMSNAIRIRALNIYGVFGKENIEKLLNRTMRSMYIDWWIHNIGYYLTLPLCHIPYFKVLNNRFKDVDLEEWKS